MQRHLLKMRTHGTHWNRFDNQRRRIMRSRLASLATMAAMAACDGASKSPLGDSTLAGPAVQAAGCSADSAVVRITVDSAGPFGAWASVGDLARLCSRYTDGQSEFGGGAGAASRAFHFPNATLTAVQWNYNDSIRTAEPAEAWVAEGPGVRLPDGSRVPTTLGQMRRYDLKGIVSANLVDDGAGVDVVLCRYPRLVFPLETEKAPSQDGQWPLSSRSFPDSVRIRHVALLDHPWPNLDKHCGA